MSYFVKNFPHTHFLSSFAPSRPLPHCSSRFGILYVVLKKVQVHVGGIDFSPRLSPFTVIMRLSSRLFALLPPSLEWLVVPFFTVRRKVHVGVVDFFPDRRRPAEAAPFTHGLVEADFHCGKYSRGGFTIVETKYQTHACRTPACKRQVGTYCP